MFSCYKDIEREKWRERRAERSAARLISKARIAGQPNQSAVSYGFEASLYLIRYFVVLNFIHNLGRKSMFRILNGEYCTLRFSAKGDLPQSNILKDKHLLSPDIPDPSRDRRSDTGNDATSCIENSPRFLKICLTVWR